MWWCRFLSLGVTNLSRHKLRSLLTMLGVMLGVASVIAMLAIGEGSKREALRQIRQLGAANVIIRSIQPRRRPRAKQGDGTSGAARQGQDFGVTLKDYDQLTETIPLLRWAVPVVSQRMNVRHGRDDLPNVHVLGTTPDYIRVKNLAVRGRFLTVPDVQGSARLAVVGSGVAQKVFGFRDAIEDSVSLDNHLFQVVGIVHTAGDAADGDAEAEGLKNEVYVPLSTFRRRFGSLRNTRLREITLAVANENFVGQTALMARTILAKTHGKQADFEVIVPLELLRQAEQEKRIWNLVLGSIGGISLLVGGIGIMNIMLTTVTERTREIGIRRALGARKLDISMQFLAETVVLSTTGGSVGVILGVVIPLVLTRVAAIETALTFWTVVVSFGISVGIGVIFGMYPAMKAADMDPIEALRHE